MNSNLDDEARAELLTFLAVSQLIARAIKREWLSDAHLQESACIWCASNGARCSVEESMRIADVSEELAREFVQMAPMRDLSKLKALFTNEWRLDYRSPVVRAMFDVCKERLLFQ